VVWLASRCASVVADDGVQECAGVSRRLSSPLSEVLPVDKEQSSNHYNGYSLKSPCDADVYKEARLLQ